MKIIYLALAKRDLRWFKSYYMQVFPQGREVADSQFLRSQKILKENPYIGHPSERVDGAREYYIPRTPFTFVYRVKDETIEVLRLLDGRSSE